MTAIVALEAIDMTRVLAYSSGRLKVDEARAIRREWLRAAGLMPAAAPRRGPMPLFAGMGVELVPARSPDDGRRR